MGLFDWLKREAGAEPGAPDDEKGGAEFDGDSVDVALRAALSPITVDRDKAMGIPAFGSAVELVSSVTAMLPIRLYHKVGGSVDVIEDDRRVRLLNGDTGDLLRAPEMRKAFAQDYLAGKGGFIYVNRVGLEVESLHYVQCGAVGIEVSSANHIFKKAMFNVDGVRYYPWQFIYACRNTTTGTNATSMVSQASTLLGTCHETMEYEQSLLKRGGNKRGFLKSPRKLAKEAVARLKAAFAKMFRRDGENFVILNDGVEWQEASETSVEMQMAENKEANYNDLYSMFLMPPSLVRGGAEEYDRDNSTRYGILPILKVFEAAINHALLLEEEKDQNYYFAYDLKEFTKADMKTRWAAWANAKKQGLVDIDQFRAEENMEPLGVKFVNLGLNDVLMDPVKNRIIIPNMGKVIDLNDLDDYTEPQDPAGNGSQTPPEGGEKSGDKTQ